MKISLTAALFTFLRVLLKVYVDQPSINIPLLFHDSGRRDTTVLIDCKLPYDSFDRPGEVTHVNTQLPWIGLRDEVDRYRIMSEHMQHFIDRHFPLSSNDAKTALAGSLKRLDLRLKELELAESNLRDRIAVYGIERSLQFHSEGVYTVWYRHRQPCRPFSSI